MNRYFIESTFRKLNRHFLLSLSCLFIVLLSGLLVPGDSHGLKCPMLSIEAEVIIQNVGKQSEERSGLNVRKNHNVEADKVSELTPRVFDGTTGTVKGIFQGEKYIWYHVEWIEPKITGWSVGIYNGEKVITTISEAVQKDKLAEVLFGLEEEEADLKTKHDENDYQCYPLDFSDETQGYNGGHGGWDVRITPEVDPHRDAYFYALTAGEVIRAKNMYLDAWGTEVFRKNEPNIIAIYGDDGRTTLYLHAREVYVSLGQRVKAGITRLGKQGKEGFATGPHVHIEVRDGRTIFSSFGAEPPSNPDLPPNIPPIPYLYKKYQEDSGAVGGGNEPSTSDVNDDGQVNILDLLMVWENIETRNLQFDVNHDGIVNKADIIIVAENLDDPAPAAPSISSGNQIEGVTVHEGQAYIGDKSLSEEKIQGLLLAIHENGNNSLASKHSIAILESILTVIVSNKTMLLPNYPNPFNPETWIPYQLAKPAEVTLTIYAINGHVVRVLDVGHQPAGMYHGKSRAAYWDGRNSVGEAVASGVYFYTLSTGDFTATQKMLIWK